LRVFLKFGGGTVERLLQGRAIIAHRDRLDAGEPSLHDATLVVVQDFELLYEPALGALHHSLDQAGYPALRP